MNTEKKCPLLNQPCIKTECAMWMNEISLNAIKNGQEQKIMIQPMCAFYASGAEAVKNIAAGIAGVIR